MTPPFMMPHDRQKRFLIAVENVTRKVANAVHDEGTRIASQSLCGMLGVIAFKMVRGGECTRDEFVEMCSTSISHAYNYSHIQEKPDA